MISHAQGNPFAVEHDGPVACSPYTLHYQELAGSEVMSETIRYRMGGFPGFPEWLEFE